MTNADPTKILQALLLNPSRSVKAFAKITKKPTKSFNKHFSYLSVKNLRMNEKKQIQNPTLNNIGKPNLIFFFNSGSRSGFGSGFDNEPNNLLEISSKNKKLSKINNDLDYNYLKSKSKLKPRSKKKQIQKEKRAEKRKKN